jgi:hypothetical protein
MAERPWYPHAPDQEFGVRLAADEQLLDRLVAILDARSPVTPRAGCKARTPGSQTAVSGVEAMVWLSQVAPCDGPVTMATALDAAADLGIGARP